MNTNQSNPRATGQAAHTPTPCKTIVLPLIYADGTERIKWRIWREPKVSGSHYNGPAWAWEDETGYLRYGPATWAEFVPYLRVYFENYAVRPLVDFS